jgi:hypothetical protein
LGAGIALGQIADINSSHDAFLNCYEGTGFCYYEGTDFA